MRETASAIRGVWSTVLCDVDDENQIDLASIERQVAQLSDAACDGLYFGGTASEVHCMCEAQYRKISVLFAQTARAHHMPFQIGATHPLPRESLERVAFAAELKPLAIQVTLPDWTPIDPNDIARFLSEIAEASRGTPIVLYNPPHAKTVLKPQALERLTRQNGVIAGLKCGGGDADWYAQMAPVLDRISVFIPGHHYASGTHSGAHGSYSNMACLSPRAAVEWKNMPLAEALNLERRIADFMTHAISPIIARGLPGFACDKAMAAAGFWTKIAPTLLWPYSGANADEVLRIADSAKLHIPEFAAGSLVHV